MESSNRISVDSPAKQVPGGFWRRFVAVFIDGIIIGVAIFPITFILSLLIIPALGPESMVPSILSWVVQIAAIYFYYGYFYSQKGASPGKMVMNLRVINSETGKNLSYNEAFLREAIGKLISTLPLFFGYIIAAFRNDKKTFHDMIFNTQVYQKLD